MTLRFTAWFSQARSQIVAAVLAAFVAASSFAEHGGPPAFRHDWQWPAVPAMFRSLWRQQLDAWSWIGFGEPNISVHVHPLYFSLAVASRFVQPFPLLVVLAGLIWGGSAFASATLLRDRFGATPAGSLTGSLLYAFAPLVVVKTVAGHVAYLTAYAALPAVLWGALGAGACDAVVLAAALAVTTVQIQVFAVSIALAFTFRRLSPPLFTAALAIASCTAAPQLWALLRPGAAVVTNTMLTSHPWELNLSSRFPEALYGLGYFEPYWQRANVGAPYPPAFLALFYALGALSMLVLPRVPYRRRLLVTYGIGVLLIAGLRGPLSIPLDAAFSRIAAASAFRELYDLSVMMTLAGSIGFGILVSRVRKPACWLLACCVALAALYPWLSGGVLSQTDLASTPASLDGRFRSIEATSPYTRVLLSPAVNPVARIDTPERSGADPLAFGYGSLSALWIYRPNDVDATLLWLIAQRSESIDRNLGVSAILVRPAYRTHEPHLSVRGQGPPFEVNSLVPPGIVGRVDSRATSIVSLRDPLPVLQLVRGRFPERTRPQLHLVARHGDDPLVSFVPAGDFWFLSQAIAGGAPSGIITLAHTARVDVGDALRGSAVDLEVLGDGTLSGHDVQARTWKPIRACCAPNITVRANPMLELTAREDRTIERAVSDFVRAPRVRLSDVSRSGDTFRARAARCDHCSLSLVERFDPGWTLENTDGVVTASRDVAGFNEWDVDTRPGDVLTLRYQPARLLMVFVNVAYGAWAIIVLAVIARGIAPAPCGTQSRCMSSD